MLLDRNGDIEGTQDTHVAYAPPVSAVGANKVHFDFFIDAAAEVDAIIHHISFFTNLDVAQVGALSTKMLLFRSSDIGTGGSLFATEPTTETRGITRLDSSGTVLPATVTMREAPGGGATAGAFLGGVYTQPEESATSMSYNTQALNMVPHSMGMGHWVVRRGSGLRMVQGAVASVGLVGVKMLFSLKAMVLP